MRSVPSLTSRDARVVAEKAWIAIGTVLSCCAPTFVAVTTTSPTVVVSLGEDCWACAGELVIKAAAARAQPAEPSRAERARLLVPSPGREWRPWPDRCSLKCMFSPFCNRLHVEISPNAIDCITFFAVTPKRPAAALRGPAAIDCGSGVHR